MLNEPYSENYVFQKLSEYKKNNLNPANYMKVIPVPFSTQGAKMLQHSFVIDSKFEDILCNYLLVGFKETSGHRRLN